MSLQTMMAATRFRKSLEKTMDRMVPELSPLTIKIKGHDQPLKDSGHLRSFIKTQRVAAGHRVYIENGWHKSGMSVHVLVWLIEHGQTVAVSSKMKKYFIRYKAFIKKSHMEIPRRPFWSRTIQKFKVVGVDISYSLYSITFLEKG